MEPKRDNHSGIVLGLLCLMYAGLVIYFLIKERIFISRSMISSGLFVISYLYLAVLALLCCKRKPFYIWCVWTILCNFYSQAIVFDLSSYSKAYDFREIPRLLRYAISPRCLIGGMIMSIPYLIFLVMALWGVRKSDGRVRLFAKILWFVPVVLNLLSDMPYAAYDSSRVSAYAKLMRTQPDYFFLGVLLPILLGISMSILTGYWLLFSGKKKENGAVPEPVIHKEQGNEAVPEPTVNEKEENEVVPEASVYEKEDKAAAESEPMREPGKQDKIYCTNCGYKLAEDDAFCTMCGTKR